MAISLRLNFSDEIYFFLAMFAGFLGGCSIAPINTATTARTLGKENNQFTASFPSTGIKYERGISDRLDLGLGVEEQLGFLLHIYGKYNLKDPKGNGLAVAAIWGGGYVEGIGDSKSFYLGPVVSYRHDSFEVFSAYRFNYVRWNFAGVSADDKNDLISIPSTKESFLYHQIDFGFNFLGDKWSTALGARAFIFPENTSVIPFIDVAYKF